MASFSSSSSSSCSSSSSQGWRYDVFLSFCGKDVRTSFADCLYNALVEAGIQTYRDENELAKGDKIGPQLNTAIQESKISIPIFSKCYTSTKWCLNELVEVFKCKKTKNQVVFPIFYKIEPRDVRNEEEFDTNAPPEYNLCLNKYQEHLVELNAEVFEEHQKDNEEMVVQRWKEAVKDVGELVGWHLKKGMYEGKLIQEVVKTVRTELQRRRFIILDNLVGIQCHIEKMQKLLDIESNCRRIIVVHGVGGIGKTTIARAVCSKVFNHFEEHRFIEDVREKAQKHGIEYLQKQLIRQEKQNIANKFDGFELIKQSFHNKKILIVLDDVSDSDQVEFLVGDGESFSTGSRVIITSRNMDIIVAPNRRTYEPHVMHSNDSLVLFSHHAFRADQPSTDYFDLSTKIVETTGGLPLALKLVGSSLYLREKSNWENVLKELQKFPNTEVMKSLKVSYGELDVEEKRIFLDVACLLIGEDKAIACYFWEKDGFSAQKGLDTLCARSMLTINEHNELKMHDQLRDFGRCIVHEENEDDAGKRSRIWSEEEAIEALNKPLNKQMGTSTVKGLQVKRHKFLMGKGFAATTKLMGEGFAAMKELRLLHLENVDLSGKITNSFSTLRWLRWYDFPLQRYPLPNFSPEKLVILDLFRSSISDKWKGWKHIKVAVNLKVLNLSYCSQLTRTPNVSTNLLLEVLILKHCHSLKEIDKSIYCLRNLIILDMSHCGNLKHLQGETFQLTSLKRLDLKGCTNLVTLPEKLGHLISLAELDLRCCESMVELPNELYRLTSLKSLELYACYRLQKLPEKLDCMTSLTMLNIRWCDQLESLPNLPSSLKHLDAFDCKSLRSLPTLSSLKHLEMLSLEGCRKLEWVPNLPQGLLCLDMSDCASVQGISGPLPSSLTSLNMSSCDLIRGISIPLPSSLTSLDTRCCYSLRDISGPLPSSLTRLWAYNCKSLVTLSSTPEGLRNLEELDLDNCGSLKEIEGVNEKLDSLVDFRISCCATLKKIPKLRGSKYLRTLKLDENHYISDFEGEGMDSLEVLKVWYCNSLRKIPYLQDSKTLRKLEISGCPLLSEIELLECYECLQELSIIKATSLERLPADLSRLKELRILNIKGCKNLIHIPRLSDLSSKLSNLDIEGCKNPTKIHGFDGLEFVEKLGISYCESLKRLPHLSNLKNLKHLSIVGCKNLTEIHDFDGLEFVEELRISCCESLERLSHLSNLKNLKRLSIVGCKNLTEIHGFDGSEFVEELHINDCESLGRLPHLSNLKNLKRLSIICCKNLTEIHGFDGLEFMEVLRISDCESLERLPHLSNLKNLKHLSIICCKNLTEIHGFDGLEFMEELDIRYCESLERLSHLSNLKNLERLRIVGCKNLIEIHGFDGLEVMEEMRISDCESLERLPHLSNLKNLKSLLIVGCKNLTEIHGFDGLEFIVVLNIGDCESLERLPHLSNLKNLKLLLIVGCKNLTEIHGVHELEFLQTLETSGCVSLERLPDLSNFQNLEELYIKSCEKLTEIQAGNGLLESLRILDIRGCTSLVTLPDLTQSKNLVELNGLYAKDYGSRVDFLAAASRELF